VQEGLNLSAVVAVAAAALVWAVLSPRLERWNVSTPLFFVAIGFLVAGGGLNLVDVGLGSEGVRTLAEFALALVLFGDAAAVDLRRLGQDFAVPGRLLGIGLPITIVLNTVVAHLLLPDLSWWVCAVIGAALAPTDAALGAAIIEDRRVPAAVREVLNIESGLNDGIATPLVSLFLVAAVGESLAGGSHGGAVLDLLLGVVGGVVVGVVGGWLLGHSATAAAGTARNVGVAALPLIAYAGMVQLGGNGFVASFVAGSAYASTIAAERVETLDLTHRAGSILSYVVWFLFGALMLPELTDLGWRDVVYAVAALTVLRMAPVALALLGAGFDRATVGIIGWFGPRGLASIVFGLLAYDELATPVRGRVVTVITATVALSVLAHGLSAAPLAGRYAGRRGATAGSGD
jgi:NhaP-type Na+/H+ or K+/H+ antiporter